MRTKWLVALALLLPAASASFVGDVHYATSASGDTALVSVDSAGNQGNGRSYAPAISADGRYAAFWSLTTNLVPGDTNTTGDVFVHDRDTAVTERISVDSSGHEGNDLSRGGAMSADGRYVAFYSQATNVVAGDTNGVWDVFLRDRHTGVTERVSVDSDGNQGNDMSLGCDVSTEGRYVAFYSEASNLVPGDTNGDADVFVHDRDTGVTERVSVDSTGGEGNGRSTGFALGTDGRYVGFVSQATNLVPGDANNTWDVFLHDRHTGVTERVSVDSEGNEGNNSSYAPTISADGYSVAFYSWASNLVAGDTNGDPDVFVHDRHTGVTERVSVDSQGNQGNDWSQGTGISANGRYVAFSSDASNLVVGDTNGVWDMFVHDRQTGTTERVSVDSDGNQANGTSGGTAMSANGRYVALQSHATNLVPGDSNGYEDVFVHDRGLACPQKKAYILVGDALALSILGGVLGRDPHIPRELTRVVAAANQEYGDMGYEVVLDWSATKDDVEQAFTDPCIRAVLMMGHGDNGEGWVFLTHDDLLVSLNDIDGWLDSIGHPQFSDVYLASCYSGSDWNRLVEVFGNEANITAWWWKAIPQDVWLDWLFHAVPEAPEDPIDLLEDSCSICDTWCPICNYDVLPPVEGQPQGLWGEVTAMPGAVPYAVDASPVGMSFEVTLTQALDEVNFRGMSMFANPGPDNLLGSLPHFVLIASNLVDPADQLRSDVVESVTVRMSYSPDGVVAAGLNEEDLRLYWHSQGLAEWERISGSVVDTEQHYVEAAVSGLGTFVIADNCPYVSNPGQSDMDSDGVGDACDNCINTANTHQGDTDSDGAGNACDTDDDEDEVLDTGDNCPLVANSGQADADVDGLGDACDPAPGDADADDDTLADDVDNCPLVANLDQADADSDGMGDTCDDDRDGDGVDNTDDDCPDRSDPVQGDADEDAVGDVCDPDDDNDGVTDVDDNCLRVSNASQVDTNGDGLGDACTYDNDVDGVPEDQDNCPLTTNPYQTDTDADGLGNLCDIDDDGDSCTDEQELGPDEMEGGQRDPLNPWDYFNPTQDGQNRVDDILAVLNHYFLDEGDEGYDQKYDRTSIPETAEQPWRLGPPNGQIRVDDILHAVNSYFHDCAP